MFLEREVPRSLRQGGRGGRLGHGDGGHPRHNGLDRPGHRCIPTTHSWKARNKVFINLLQ